MSRTESAFPIFIPDDGEYRATVVECGLTKRELFAAMALQGAIANAHLKGPSDCASFALQAADTLLALLSDETNL